MPKREAATFGQDLMRGEHIVGGGMPRQRKAELPDINGAAPKETAPGLTWVGGGRAPEDLDETSLKNLQATSSGTSIFDPVLCELVYRWFCPPGGTVLDPFAGGSVRGIVAAMLGRSYIGVELRPEQVAANEAQWRAISAGRRPAARPSAGTVNDPDDLTPVQKAGSVYVKRDDLFAVNGVAGGKVRTCLALARRGIAAGAGGLVTAGSRASPQVNIVSHVGESLGVPVRCHTPQGELSPEVRDAQSHGAEIVQHKAGYNTVIVKRARDDAAKRGWVEIPFGMECAEAIAQTRRQISNLPAHVDRIVMPCGSGMSLSGVLWGLVDIGRQDVRVVAVQVGADPSKRLTEYAPPDWASRVDIIPSGSDYHKPASVTDFEGIPLDAHYEAKCLPFLKPGDLFWIVGIRATSEDAAPASGITVPSNAVAPRWIVGDSRNIATLCVDVQADLVFSCPPYADLERYSDDPADLSTMPYTKFREAYCEIIEATAGLLKPDRFACFVVGDARDKRGLYYGFPWHTVQAFVDAGLRLYNEAVLVTAVGSLPLRVRKQFESARKLGRTHQNLLQFVKGDPRKATAAIGPVEFGDVPEAEAAD